MLSTPTSFIFFAIFAVILIVTYLAIRREWAPIGIVSGLSTVGSVISMLLVSLSQGNAMFQAIIVSLGMGIVFSLSTVAIAVFFHTSEMREKHANTDLSSPIADTE